MIEFKNCLRCGSEKLAKLKVNTHIKLNYPEKKSLYTQTVTQRVIEPTHALVCEDCGHIEFFIDLQ